jgi:hypothetical protein
MTAIYYLKMEGKMAMNRFRVIMMPFTGQKKPACRANDKPDISTLCELPRARSPAGAVDTPRKPD